MSDADVAEYKRELLQFVTRDPIPSTWDSATLDSLIEFREEEEEGMAVANPANVEDTQRFCVNDVLVLPADATTPSQRFWLAEVLLYGYFVDQPTPRCKPCPNPAPGKVLWYHVWWFSASGEYTIYKQSYASRINGKKTKNLEWVRASSVITRLPKGLTSQHTIRVGKAYRRTLAKQIRDVVKPGHADEGMPYEEDEDDPDEKRISLTDAKDTYRGRRISDFAQQGDTTKTVGTIVDIAMGDEGYVLFSVHFEGDPEQQEWQYPHAQIVATLIDETE